jgi:glutamate--cysteine ligase
MISPIDIKPHLREQFMSKWNDIQSWFDGQFESLDTPITGSVDIRDGGLKIAPVDANAFPAGWNNLCHADKAASKEIFKKIIKSKWPEKEINHIHIIPENHSRNTFYWENIYNLKSIIGDTVNKITIGSPDFPENLDHKTQTLEAMDGKTVNSIQTTFDDGEISTPEGKPDLIIINNDFSKKYSYELDQSKQLITPNPKLGWFNRTKSHHFEIYKSVLSEFSSKFDVDPFQLSAEFRNVEDIDFQEKIGIERIQETVSEFLNHLRSEYKKRDIPWRPKVFLKSNTGTYGMGITIIEDASELNDLSKRKRNKLDVTKNRQKTTSVILQEGVPTRVTDKEGFPAEPAIYVMNGTLAGGFLRSNTERGDNDNLNSKGMVFRKLCMEELRRSTENDLTEETVYGTIARLSALAMAKESEKLKNE